MNITNGQLQCCCSSRIRQFHRAELHYIFAHGNLLCTGNIPPPWVLLLKQIGWGKKKKKKDRGLEWEKITSLGRDQANPHRALSAGLQKSTRSFCPGEPGISWAAPSHPPGHSPCHATRSPATALPRNDVDNPTPSGGGCFPTMLLVLRSPAARAI